MADRNEKLRELVRRAYEEGAADGASVGWSDEYLPLWEDSHAFAALEAFIAQETDHD